MEMSFCFKHESPFQFDVRNGAGFQIIAMLITGSVAFALLIAMETNSQRMIYLLEFLSWQKIRNAFSFSALSGKRGGVPNLCKFVFFA